MPPDNEYQAVAIAAVTPVDNVTPALEFALTQALTAADPARCYDPQLIRCAAVASLTEQESALTRLRTKYGKECNKTIWRRLVREARQQLTVPAPSALILSDNGSPKAILANAIIQLKASGIDLAYDTFASRITIQKPSPWGTEGPWSDRDDLEAANYLQHRKVLVSSATTHEAANLLAYQQPFHPVRDWLCRLKWDGSPRLDTWMCKYLGAVARDERYLTGISNAWPISAVARIIRPGCFAKHLIVLEGKQSIGKSRALRALTNGHMEGEGGVQWFRDSLPDIDSDDIGLYMQGVWVIEIAELEAIRGKMWTRVKAFISTQSDPFRRKFGRNMAEYPRQCIFAGSTNEEHWGGDTTGLTRFWPVAATKIDVDGILRVREQLFAEARFKFDEGASVFLDQETEALAAVEQQDRAPDDAWVELIATKLALQTETSMTELLEKLGEKKDSGNSRRAAQILSYLGWSRFRSSTAEGRHWVYRRRE